MAAFAGLGTPLVVTRTFTVPVPAGAVARNCVALTNVTPVAAVVLTNAEHVEAGRIGHLDLVEQETHAVHGADTLDGCRKTVNSDFQNHSSFICSRSPVMRSF